jgi:hypothetical protein
VKKQKHNKATEVGVMGKTYLAKGLIGKWLKSSDVLCCDDRKQIRFRTQQDTTIEQQCANSQKVVSPRHFDSSPPTCRLGKYCNYKILLQKTFLERILEVVDSDEAFELAMKMRKLQMMDVEFYPV